jgi:hypothetical protein
MVLSPQEQQTRKSQWIDLALLYKEIDESEIFQNVYLTNVATDDLARVAINAEIRGEYIEAFNNFKRADLEYPDQTDEHDLWKEQMLYCYTQLTQWDDIANSVNKSLNNEPLKHIWEPENKVNCDLMHISTVILNLQYFYRTFILVTMSDLIPSLNLRILKIMKSPSFLKKNYACGKVI